MDGERRRSAVGRRALCALPWLWVAAASTVCAQGFGDRVNGPWLDPSGLSDDPTQRFFAFTLVSLGLAVLVWAIHTSLSKKRRQRQRRTRGVNRPRPAPPTTTIPLPQQTHRRLPTLEADLEVEIFGQGENAGYCVRAIIVHVDNHYVVVRLNDEDLEMPCPLVDGDAIAGYFWRAGDAGYIFNTEIVENRHVGQTYLLLRPPRELERHQRRLHVRVPYCEGVSFLRIPAGFESESLGKGSQKEALHTGNVEDLSAGGVRLRCWTPLCVEDFVSIWGFSLLPNTEVLARVVSIDRLQQPGDAEDAEHEYGLSFVGITARDRDVVTKRVFELQRRAIVTEKEREAQQRETLESASLTTVADLEMSTVGEGEASARLLDENPMSAQPSGVVVGEQAALSVLASKGVIEGGSRGAVSSDDFASRVGSRSVAPETNSPAIASPTADADEQAGQYNAPEGDSINDATFDQDTLKEETPRDSEASVVDAPTAADTLEVTTLSVESDELEDELQDELEEVVDDHDAIDPTRSSADSMITFGAADEMQVGVFEADAERVAASSEDEDVSAEVHASGADASNSDGGSDGDAVSDGDAGAALAALLEEIEDSEPSDDGATPLALADGDAESPINASDIFGDLDEMDDNDVDAAAEDRAHARTEDITLDTAAEPAPLESPPLPEADPLNDTQQLNNDV